MSEKAVYRIRRIWTPTQAPHHLLQHRIFGLCQSMFLIQQHHCNISLSLSEFESGTVSSFLQSYKKMFQRIQWLICDRLLLWVFLKDQSPRRHTFSIGCYSRYLKVWYHNGRFFGSEDWWEKAASLSWLLLDPIICRSVSLLSISTCWRGRSC